MTLANVFLILNIGNTQLCIANTTYGPNECDRDCNSFPYEGIYGNLTVPLKFHYSVTNTNINQGNINSLLTLVNLQFNSKDIPIRFVNLETVENQNIGIDYCQYNPNSGECDCSNFGGTSYYQVKSIAEQHLNSLNIFLFENIYLEKEEANLPCEAVDYLSAQGNASYPVTEQPPNGINNYLLIKNSILNDINHIVLAHELGHLLGLHHTFEDDIFNNSDCDQFDGIFDTGDGNNNGFDDNTNSTVTCNLMDYGGFDPVPFPGCPGILDITQCQKAKIMDVLFECRTNLCSYPYPPNLSINGNLVSSNIDCIGKADLDILVAVLDENKGTNSNGFAKFTFKHLNGEIVNSYYTNSLDLDLVFDGSNVPRTGQYILEVIDSSIYSICNSEPRIYTILFNQNITYEKCFDIVYADYRYQCGQSTLSEVTAEQFRYGGRDCDTDPGTVVDNTITGGNGGGNGGPGGPGGPGGSGTGTNIGTGTSLPKVKTNNEDCHECLNEIKRKILEIKTAKEGN